MCISERIVRRRRRRMRADERRNERRSVAVVVVRWLVYDYSLTLEVSRITLAHSLHRRCSYWITVNVCVCAHVILSLVRIAPPFSSSSSSFSSYYSTIIISSNPYYSLSHYRSRRRTYLHSHSIYRSTLIASPIDNSSSSRIHLDQ